MHLFRPLKIGSWQLDHRVVMAPLTRLRATKPGNVANAMNAPYYAQRATRGGLIIGEASPISEEAHFGPGAPGVFTDAQIAGWKSVADAIHDKGGKFVLQLWHIGRATQSSKRAGNVRTAWTTPRWMATCNEGAVTRAWSSRLKR